MSLEYHLGPEFLRYETHGDVDFAEGLKVFQEGLAAAAAVPSAAPWPVLFDIRESTERRRGDELKGIAVVLGEHLGVVAAHCAVVVSTPLFYGVSRMFGSFTEEVGVTLEVFESVTAAEVWLRERTAEGA